MKNNIYLTRSSDGSVPREAGECAQLDVSIVFSDVPGSECVYAYGGTIATMRQKMYLYDFFRRNGRRQKASSLRMATARHCTGYLTEDDFKKARHDPEHARFVIELAMASASTSPRP